jgi:nitrite reductase/ring-hydroxylating ferredoxin subunit
MSPTLAQYWHPIGTSEDVTGEPRRFLLLGEALVAFRDEQGPAVFKDLCIHRGAALSLGSVANGHITCPYHGWEYDRTGACVRIPSLPEGQSIPKKARAIAYRVQEAYGLVWVAMEEPVAPVPIWPRDAWNDPRFTSFLTYRCVWKTSAGRDPLRADRAKRASHLRHAHHPAEKRRRVRAVHVHPPRPLPRRPGRGVRRVHEHGHGAGSCRSREPATAGDPGRLEGRAASQGPGRKCCRLPAPARPHRTSSRVHALALWRPARGR